MNAARFVIETRPVPGDGVRVTVINSDGEPSDIGVIQQPAQLVGFVPNLAAFVSVLIAAEVCAQLGDLA